MSKGHALPTLVCEVNDALKVFRSKSRFCKEKKKGKLKQYGKESSMGAVLGSLQVTLTTGLKYK